MDGGCGGEEGRQQKGVIIVWLVYLLLVGYGSGYVLCPGCNCVLRCGGGEEYVNA